MSTCRRIGFPVLAVTAVLASSNSWALATTESAACCLRFAVCLDANGQLARTTLGATISCESAPCPANTTCETQCAELIETDCDEVSGYWLGSGNVPPSEPPVTSCASGRCAFGACCRAPGVCQDRFAIPVPCNTTETGSCLTRAYCDAVGGEFVPGAMCHYRTQPCPFCDLESDDNCQPGVASPPGTRLLGWTGFGTRSDGSVGAPSPSGFPLRAADDFVPLASPLSRLCVQGFYADMPFAQHLDCAELVTDDFLVRVYQNDPATNRPGALVATRIGVASRGKEFENIIWRDGPIDIWRIQLQLNDPQNPAVPLPVALNPGQCYWLEVINDPKALTPGTAETCDFFLTTRMSNGHPRDGNDYFAARFGDTGWSTGTADLAFCLDVPFQAGGCGQVTGTCCTDYCAPGAGTCEVMTKSTCDATDPQSLWDGEFTDCGQFGDACPPGPPPGDDCTAIGDSCPGPGPFDGVCAGGPTPGTHCDDGDDCAGNGGCNCNADGANGPQLISSVPVTPTWERALVEFSTHCATTDGANPVPTYEYQFPAPLANDVWFRFRAGRRGYLTIDTCGTLGLYAAGGFDSFIAVYRDPNNPTVCACPTTAQNFAWRWPDNLGSDDACDPYYGVGGRLGPRLVEPGACFMIRVGNPGWDTQQPPSGDTGKGVLQISLEEELCEWAEPAEIVQHDSDPTPAVALTALKMNRYLGVRAPGSAGRQQAIRVWFRSLPPPWDLWNDTKLWVTSPVTICEQAGSTTPPPGGCSGSSIAVAGLTCNPADAAFLDWTTLPGGTVYVHHPGIVPSNRVGTAVDAEYMIQMLDSTCNYADAYDYVPVYWLDGPWAVTQARFGDACGPYGQYPGYYVNPDGRVDVTTDVAATINKFANRFWAPSKPRVDVEPCVVDGKVNISDVTLILNAFRSLPFPFAPAGGFGCTSPDPCSYAP